MKLERDVADYFFFLFPDCMQVRRCVVYNGSQATEDGYREITEAFVVLLKSHNSVEKWNARCQGDKHTL